MPQRKKDRIRRSMILSHQDRNLTWLTIKRQTIKQKEIQYGTSNSKNMFRKMKGPRLPLKGRALNHCQLVQLRREISLCQIFWIKILKRKKNQFRRQKTRRKNRIKKIQIRKSLVKSRSILSLCRISLDQIDKDSLSP